MHGHKRGRLIHPSVMLFVVIALLCPRASCERSNAESVFLITPQKVFTETTSKLALFAYSKPVNSVAIAGRESSLNLLDAQRCNSTYIVTYDVPSAYPVSWIYPLDVNISFAHPNEQHVVLRKRVKRASPRLVIRGQTDKPVYQPGDTVHLRFIAFDSQPGGLRPRFLITENRPDRPQKKKVLSIH